MPPSSAQVGEPLQGREARQEEVLAAAQYVERFDAVHAAPHRLLRDGEGRSRLLPPDDRVALASRADEIALVDPLLLQELDGGHCLGADEQEVRAVRYLIVSLGHCGRIVWRSVGGATRDQAVDVDVGQTR